LHLLQSTSIPAVTQSRATTDYQPGGINWRVGYPSLLIWALGVVPFKDDFWTSNNQTGCVYRTCYEPNPDLITIIAVLTTGPVGPSDKIGSMNTTRVMGTCRKDGLLLKPDIPAIPLDIAFKQFDWSVEPVEIEVWRTFSHYDSGLVWHYILGADLAQDFTIRPDDLEEPSGFDGFALNYMTGRLQRFNAKNNLILPKKKDVPNVIDFTYFVVAPVLSNGWVLLGELAKYVPMSKQRFVEIDTGSRNGETWLEVTIAGQAKENVELYFMNPGSEVPFSVSCAIGYTLTTKVRCSSMNRPLCSCLN